MFLYLGRWALQKVASVSQGQSSGEGYGCESLAASTGSSWGRSAPADQGRAPGAPAAGSNALPVTASQYGARVLNRGGEAAPGGQLALSAHYIPGAVVSVLES